MNNLMRINEQFVTKLLHDTEPLEAVSNLSQFWSPRLNGSLLNFGLSKTEYEVQLCLIYFGEVYNGAHFQYFTNRGTEFCNDTIAALRTTKLVKYSEILSNAVLDLPSDLKYMDGNNVSARTLDHWDNADEIFYEIDLNSPPASDYNFYLLEHLRNNSDDVLTKERGQKIQV